MSLFTRGAKRVAAVGATLLMVCGPRTADGYCYGSRLSASGMSAPLVSAGLAVPVQTGEKREPKPAKPDKLSGDRASSPVPELNSQLPALGEKGGNPTSTPCPPASLLSDIESAESYLDQAIASPSLPPEIGASLQDASQRLHNLETYPQSVFESPRCDASSPPRDTPLGNEDLSILLALSSHYLTKAGGKTAVAGLDTQFGPALRAVMLDVEKAKSSLPAREPPGTGKAPEFLLGAAALVFLLALSVAFWYPQIRKLTKQVRVLSNSVDELGVENSRAQSELSSLHGQFRVLEQTIEQHEAGLRHARADPDEDGRQDMRDMAAEETVLDAPRLSQPASDNSAHAEKYVEDHVVGPSAVSSAPILVRDPVTDYNHTRGLRASDRVESFRKMYPSQRKLECVNSSARMSADPANLRFRDDPLGNLLAVVEGQRALIFPNLTYGYDTGRNSLEGVFAYPPDGVASARVLQAAVAEREGDEWRLRTRGQFGG